MNVCKLLASVSLLMCLSGSVVAMDIGSFYPSGRLGIQSVGWDQKSLEAQMQGAVFLRAQINKLEQENEQLRNSLSQMRGKIQNTRPAPVGRDPRIQALIEENKRLSHKLLNSGQAQHMSADVYTQKLYVLEAENHKIREQLSQKKMIKSGGNSILKQENLRLKSSLSAMISLESGYVDKVSVLEKKVRILKESNAVLVSSSLSNKTSKEAMGKMLSLQSTIHELQKENRHLAQTLAKSSDTLLGLHERADIVQNQKNMNARSVLALKSRLAEAQKRNVSLNIKIKKMNQAKPVIASASNPDGMKLLQKQNQSLRETIRAQNNVLVSADNATKTGERLLTENAMLKRKLDVAGKAVYSNGKSAKDLFARNVTLENGIEKRNNYIKKLEGLKDTVKQLRLENDRYVMGQIVSNSVNERIITLDNEKKYSEALLKKERANATQYKMKIREYQEEIASIKNGQSKETAQKISDYKSNIFLLKKGQESQDNKITALKLANQELEAQIRLFSEMADMKAVSENKTIIARTHENQKLSGGDHAVTFVETSYPSVEQIAPLLNHDGLHRYDKDHATEGSELLSISEILLSQKLKPLPER